MPTLFYDPEVTVNWFNKFYKTIISLNFVNCANQQLTPIFEQRTGLKINKQISISWVADWRFSLEIGLLSKVLFSICVNHNWNDITIIWHSKSGKTYDLADTDIDCNDIVFDFEGLDAALYHRQLYPGYKFPFKLKDLSYELEVNRLNVDCGMTLQLKPEKVAEAERIVFLVDDYLDGFNQKSEKSNRKYGLVHNWKSTIEGDKIVFDMDIGSAGPKVFKGLLPYLSKLDYFVKVIID